MGAAPPIAAPGHQSLLFEHQLRGCGLCCGAGLPAARRVGAPGSSQQAGAADAAERAGDAGQGAPLHRRREGGLAGAGAGSRAGCAAASQSYGCVAPTCAGTCLAEAELRWILAAWLQLHGEEPTSEELAAATEQRLLVHGPVATGAAAAATAADAGAGTPDSEAEEVELADGPDCDRRANALSLMEGWTNAVVEAREEDEGDMPGLGPRGPIQQQVMLAQQQQQQQRLKRQSASSAPQAAAAAAEGVGSEHGLGSQHELSSDIELDLDSQDEKLGQDGAEGRQAAEGGGDSSGGYTPRKRCRTQPEPGRNMVDLSASHAAAVAQPQPRHQQQPQRRGVQQPRDPTPTGRLAAGALFNGEGDTEVEQEEEEGGELEGGALLQQPGSGKRCLTPYPRGQTESDEGEEEEEEIDIDGPGPGRQQGQGECQRQHQGPHGGVGSGRWESGEASPGAVPPRARGVAGDDFLPVAGEPAVAVDWLEAVGGWGWQAMGASLRCPRAHYRG